MAEPDKSLEELKTEAEIRKLDLESSNLELTHAKLKNEARRWAVEAVKAERELDTWDSSPDEHGIYYFFGEVDAMNVATAIDVLGMWSRRWPGKEFSIVYNSPGGSIMHGLALYDFITELKSSGHKINTVARGMAASMGGVLLQAGDERIIGDNCQLLIHEASALSLGKLTEMEDEIKFVNKLQDRLLNILAERSTLTKQQIRNRWRRKDWWLDSKECIEYGFADRIG